MIDPLRSPLLTDLYQLTMLQGYFDHGMVDTAVFEFFIRKMPPKRGFLLAAGLEQVLEFLEGLRFGDDELRWLRDSGRFNPSLINGLAGLRFTGDVYAMSEGTIFYTDEPILRVVAPLPQAQLVESRIINILHYQTLVATKAARCVLAAPDKLLVDFGLRRTHGAEAGVFAARASYIAGFSGTSTVVAEPLYGIPIYGTMAHSFIQAHESEETAFEHFSVSQRDNVVLLIDTYDTEGGAATVVRLAPRLREHGIRIKAVRIDSGDLLEHSRRVRDLLDRGGLEDTGIFASGNLDEFALRDLLACGAPIDGFGVGTRLDTSADAPYFDCAYKLQEYAGIARRKRSEGKATWPGRKQVFRYYDNAGLMSEDELVMIDEIRDGECLLQPFMRNGRRLEPATKLNDIRERTRTQLSRLPERLRPFSDTPPYPVRVSDAVRKLAARIDAEGV